MSEKPRRYTDAIANAFSEAKAWRATSFLLGGLVVALTVLNIYQAVNTPTALVPYNFATTGKTVTVKTTGEVAGTSEEYLTNLALADLALGMTFTPETAMTSHLRFLNRLTPALYAAEQNNLKAQARRFKEESRTQVFYPNETKVIGDTVEVTGTVVQWTGDKEVLRSRTTYVVKYEITLGYFHVADLRQKQ